MIHVFCIFAEDALPKPSTKLAPTTSCVPRLALTKSGFVFIFLNANLVMLRCVVSRHFMLCCVLSCLVVLSFCVKSGYVISLSRLVVSCLL